MKILGLIIISLFISKVFIAQTILPTTFDSDTFLDVSDSPYLVTSNPIINSGVTVQFEKGCTIMFDQGKAFNVSGTLKLIGEENDSITLITNTGATYWGPITTNSGNLIFDYTVLQNPRKIISASHGVVNINNSRISAVIGTIGEDGIAIHYADTVIITNSTLESNPDGGKIDAIDADGIGYGNISNNIIRHWPDDGVDIGSSSHNVSINNNIIYDVDFGISVGESSTVYAERNIIHDSYAGIQSHDGATLTADHNTIFRTVRSLQPHHGTSSNSGGTLIVTNTIMNSASYLDYSTQSNSVLTMSYCLSNKDTLPGNNNLFDDALFVDTLTNNFHLTENSPAIDSGDPNYSGSFNGLFTDIGAYEYDSANSIINIISNKNKSFGIYPNPATNNLHLIFNEKTSKNAQIIDVTGRIQKSIRIDNSNSTINISDIKSGIYFIRVGVDTIKFIKK